MSCFWMGRRVYAQRDSVSARTGHEIYIYIYIPLALNSCQLALVNKNLVVEIGAV
jgi:hypothetical protein